MPLNRAIAEPVTEPALDEAVDFQDPDFCAPVHGSKNYELLFATLYISGHPIQALLDGGSTRSYVSAETETFLRSLGIPVIKARHGSVIMAAGQRSIVRDRIRFSVTFYGVTREITTRILPSLTFDCIVGLDFLNAFSIIVDHENFTWWFKNSPEEIIPFERAYRAGSSPECNGIIILNEEQNTRLKEVLDSEIITPVGITGGTDLIQHDIDVGSHPAIRQRSHRVSPKVQEAINAEVEKMLAEKVIEPSQSEWASPIVMVLKPNRSYRFCIDFREVNRVSKRDAYPLPRMDSILDKLRSARYISTIDLSQAYFQVPLTERSREITAFIVPGKGLFHFRRMPFGLTGAPAMFQRLLDRLIGPELEPHAFAYLDDIIIVAETFDEHLYWLRIVLRIIRKAGLIINLEKSKFCCSEVKYLGFVVNENGLQVDPDKIQPVINYPVPTNLKELRKLIGMASWYRRFVPNFSTVMEPLNKLLRKNQPWIWTEEQELAFLELRTRLTTAPTLTRPDFSLPFVLQTDASAVGLGAVLTQSHEDGEHVIAYASKTLSSAERKYSVTERECLAVIWAIRKYRPYIEGYHFTVVTDHSSLQWLHNLKNPTGRLARWALELLGYDYTIVFRKGALNHVPDALSRIPEGNPELVAVIVPRPATWYERRKQDIINSPKKYPAWKIENDSVYFYRPDPTINDVIRDLSAWKLVVPDDDRNLVLQNLHSEPQAGHLGIEKTYKRIATSHYWPGLFKDVTNIIKRCVTCQRCKVEQRVPAGLMGRRVVEQPWVVVAMDMMGPFPPSRNGYVYVLVIQDLFTRWMECCPLKKATGKKICEAFEELVISRWGAPEVILTDNGTEFKNHALRELAETYNITHTTTPPYHPQANPVERVNRILKTMIISFLERDHRDWDLHLSEFRFAYNTASHSSLHTSPAFLNFGRNPKPANQLPNQNPEDLEVERQPPELWAERMKRMRHLRDWVTENVDDAFTRQAEQYNRHHRPELFAVGDLVLKRHHVLTILCCTACSS